MASRYFCFFFALSFFKFPASGNCCVFVPLTYFTFASRNFCFSFSLRCMFDMEYKYVTFCRLGFLGYSVQLCSVLLALLPAWAIFRIIKAARAAQLALRACFQIISDLALALSMMYNTYVKNSTPVGFEPTRGDPIGLAGRRLNHSAKVSLATVTSIWTPANVCIRCHRWYISLFLT